uniref:Sialin n=1 Tax=Strigamia maritima TaxID=126957 RepID=T1JB34_STRMM
MVAMINTSALPHAPNLTSDCGYKDDDSDDPLAKSGEFVWDESTQGLILGSFFWGYIFTQIPGGRLAEILGGKWLLGGGVLITAIFTLLTPLAARNGVVYLIVVRVCEGFGEGVTFPAMHRMISQWAPINERSRFVTVIFAGSLLGTVIGLPISSYLCVSDIAGGWPSVFYVFGAVGVLWFIAWAFLAYENPASHPWISTEEKIYILRGVKPVDDIQDIPPLPWKKMLRSLPLWAIVAAHFGNNWGFYTFLTELPTYLDSILHFNMRKSGLLSALPYFVCWLCSLLVSVACDKLVEKNYLRLRNARKLFNSIGLIFPAVLLIGLTFVGCDSSLSYAILGMAMGINGCIYAGFQGNHIDIASNYAGTLMGITNTIATIPGMIGPYVAGALTQGKPYKSEWAKVFYISAAIYTAGGVFYIIFGKAEEQVWNKVGSHEKDVNNGVDNLHIRKTDLP